MIFVYLIVFCLCLLIIVRSGTILVHSLVGISRFLRLSEYVVAFILMAFATSVPELFVGLTSAISHKPILSLGNVIGANVINLTLALGLVILVARGIDIKSQTAKKDAWLIFFLAVLPVLLVLDGQLTRIDGTILLLFFVWYIWRLLSRKEEFTQILNTFKHTLVQFKDFLKNLGLFTIGLAFLLAGAWGAVWSASLIAEELNISLLFIGLILVALGTTLPEIAFGLRSVLMQHEEMTLGNFIGSVAFNSLFVLGLVAVICPIQVDNLPLVQTSGLVLALVLIIFNIFIRTRDRLSYKEGVVFLALYVFFLTIETLMR